VGDAHVDVLVAERTRREGELLEVALGLKGRVRLDFVLVLVSGAHRFG
jgi:hypothetical protein